MMKLYYAPGACSLASHIALREAGLGFDLEKVDLKEKKTEKGSDYWAINAKGSVPALELDNADVLTEGPVILQYVADQSPAARLIPASGTAERYRCQEWLNYLTAEVHKSFSPLFKPQTPEAYKAQAKELIGTRFDFIANHLRDREYLMGDAFTIADAYLFTVLRWTKPTEIDLSQWPVLGTYIGHVQARPKVTEALKAEGQLT